MKACLKSIIARWNLSTAWFFEEKCRFIWSCYTSACVSIKFLPGWFCKLRLEFLIKTRQRIPSQCQLMAWESPLAQSNESKDFCRVSWAILFQYVKQGQGKPEHRQRIVSTVKLLAWSLAIVWPGLTTSLPKMSQHSWGDSSSQYRCSQHVLGGKNN